jgi:hypothetical protein
MDADTIRRLDAEARQRFTYRPDAVDNWRSHGDEVLRGEDWQGDCDDLASTVLDLLGRNGMALGDRYRLLVSTLGESQVDHMVACAVDADGHFWIVGDTFAPAYPAALMKHRGLFYNRLTETQPKAVWRDGVPWGMT